MINTSSSSTHLNFFHSLRGKLILLFLAVSLIPLILVGLLAYIQAQNALKAEVINKLVAVRDMKANRITKYFEERLSDVKVLSKNPTTIAAIHAFDQTVEASQEHLGTDEVGAMNHYRSLYLDKLSLVKSSDGSTYSSIHAQYHQMFKEYQEAYGYYDIFLVEPHAGNIVYSVMKETDFGTSLKNGPYANTNLGDVFQKTVIATDRDFTRLEDFAYYEPSQEAASFVASPIFDNDSKLVGVLIFQMPIVQIDTIMQEHTGLGETGETLLVSSDDFLLRSDSRFSDTSTLFKQKMDNQATRASATGETGVKTIHDEQEQSTLVAYTPLNISGVRWSLNAKMDESEAFVAAQQTLILMLTILGIGSIIVMAVALFFSNSIAKPVQTLTKMARQLAAGDMNLTVDINRQDEIGVMANAFRQMITNLQQVIEDIVQLSQGLAAGNLRITPQSEYQGNFIQIKTALETALSDLRQVIEDIVQVSHGLADGNLNVTPQATYQGDFVQIKNTLEKAFSDQRQVIEDIVQVSQGLAAGNLHVTPQSEYRGDFIQIKIALETVLSNQLLVVEDIVQISQGLAKGNLRVTHQAEYQGDFVQIRNALESAFSNQRQVIEDIVQVSQGLAEGNLRITPQFEYQGDFAQIKIALEMALSNQRQVIEDIVQVSQGLAEGNLNVTPQSEYRGDFAYIKNAQKVALSNQRQVIEDIVQVSQGLAGGKLDVMSQAIYRGDFVQIKTALETALSNLRQVIEDIVHVSQSLAEGEQIITPQALYQGDFIQIKNALQTAATKLATTTAQNATQDWLKTGQAQLNTLMSGEQEIVALAKKIISFLTTYTEAQVGLFYLRAKTEQAPQKAYLQMIASYAYTANDNIPNQFSLGEGLVGQVALEQKTLYRTHTPEEYTHIIQSGLANTVPRYVILLPCLYENAVKAVIEIGASHAFTPSQKDFLEQVTSSIGIAINTAKSRTQMQTLLQKSQRQTEELQTQSEELQSQQEELHQINEELQHQREELENRQAELQQRNEELQTQSEELQSQSEELQTQQEELKQTNEALEERTKDLEQQKAEIQHKNLVLEQTQVEMKKAQVAIEAKAQELELASQYKSEFLANMSHELRTPLNSLLILAQLLSENKAGNLTDKQVEYAQTIHSAGSDLLTLINEILDLSKVEAGKIEVQLEDVSLSDLVETLKHKFRLMASEKGLAFHIHLMDELLPILHTDGQRLKQIINNLLSNAFKFTQKGEIKLDIKHPANNEEIAFRNLEATQTIAFSVTDTGIGIPADKQQVIFEAFQQADGSTSRRFGGTGLGLSISRQLAKLLGGELQLHSEEGKGSTFTLYLPQYHKENQTNLSAPQSLVPKNEPDSTTTIPTLPTSEEKLATPVKEAIPIKDDREKLNANDKTILIIEDDRKFSKILMELAQGKDFKCIIAEDGRTGLQMAEEYKPNAIILDVTLPNLDGWTVMDKLKDNPDTRHIPVHFISAADQSQDAGKMGAIGYLHKPVNMEQLGWAFKKIEQFITKTVKNLLVVVDFEPHQQKILGLIEAENVQTTQAMTIATAIQHLKSTEFDCIILDMDIEQQSGYQLVEQMQKIKGLCQTPVIVYAERELTSEEEALLLRCADNLTIKAVRSSERLLDEATLFLHQVEAKLSTDKRNMLRMVHDKESILANKKVLIVDDDARNTFALATVLEEKNMEVFAGNNGNEALELLEENPDISIILMDIMMPEMDGYEATRQIRNQLRFRKLPIIALTAKAMKGDKSKCIEAGANDYLSKPVDTDKLLSLMRVWLYR